MSTRWAPIPAAIAIVALAAGCGTDTPARHQPTGAQLAVHDSTPGGCDDPKLAGESASAASRLLRKNITWAETNRISLGQKKNREYAAALANPHASNPNAKAPSANVRLHEDVAGRLPSNSGGRPYLVAIIDGEVVMTALLDTKGGAEFVGPCERLRLQQPVESYATARKLTPATVLRELARDPNGPRAKDLAAFFTPPAPLSWEDEAPGLRQFNPEDTPQAVLDTLGTIQVQVQMPDQWRTDDQVEVLLCGRTTIAWSDCSSQKGAEDAGGLLEFSVLIVPNAPTSLWLLNSAGDFSAPIGRLIDLGTVADGAIISVKPKPEVLSLDEFVAEARAGLDPLQFT